VKYSAKRKVLQRCNNLGQKNAWMTWELMEVWLGCVWEYWAGVLSRVWSMLAMDTFCGHLSVRIKNRLRHKNTNLVIIPSGMRSQLEPLDVLVNKPFKYLVCKHCDAWLNKDNHILTTSDKIKKASASIIAEWISKAWKEVPDNIIPESFLKCYLSNMDDGMQNNMLWDDGEQSGEGSSSSEMQLKDHWTNFLIK
jgi:hypothetical protein